MGNALATAALAALPPEDRYRLLRDEYVRRARAQKAVEPFSRYEHDLGGFARNELGVTLWARQEEILASADVHQLTCVSSGQKTGKSLSFGALALGWVTTRPRGLVIMTSGNRQQVKTILWRELKAIAHRSGIVERLGAQLNDDPANGLLLPDGRAIYGLTADDAERMAGYSGDQLLVIVDEASGFDDLIFEAVRGNLLGGGHGVFGGNPTRTSGWFYDFHSTGRGQANLIRIDSRETPNYIEGRMVIPGLATREAVQALADATGGDGSPIFDVRVAGRFPTRSDKSVVSLGSLEAAIARWSPQLAASAKAPLRIGVDVARFGEDDSVMQPVRGNVALVSKVVHGLDAVEVAGETMAMARKLSTTDSFGRSERPTIVVDGGGIGGPVVDILRRHASAFHLVDVDAGSKADDEEHMHRMRDQLWWGVRTWLDEGGALPPDPKRDAELLAPSYGFDERARVRVESKDAIRKRIGRSPDRGDALCLAVSNTQRGQAVRAIHIRGA